MGVTFKRKKKKNLLLSLIYRLNKIPILSKKKKFELLLNLEWIFERLLLKQASIFPGSERLIKTLTFTNKTRCP